MCGIAGLFGPWQESTARSILRRMLDAIAHRGRDGEGLEVESTIGPEPWSVGLGHRRLAILDLSPAGLQPMHSTDRRLSIILNGEIYNYLELREELKGLGHHFHTGSDTEVLLNAYAQWGPQCLSRLNGMWAFALWDRSRSTMFLARDRMGVKPLYYARSKTGWMFASEPKALFATGELKPQYRPEAVEAYLSHGLCSFDEETFFDGVRQVPPGCFMELSVEAPVAIQRYWDLPEDDDGAPSPTAAEIRDVFLDAVALRLRSDVPVGVSLSGGVDSSAIACAVARVSSRERAKSFSTFTVTYPGMDFDEGDWARQLSERLGAPAIYAPGFDASDDRVNADLRTVIAACDEPIHSPSIYNVLSLMRTVRRAGVSVVLGGQGADEMFWGYPWCYAYSIAHWARHGQHLRALQELTAVVAGGNSPPTTVAAYLLYQTFFTPRYWRGVARAVRYFGPALKGVGSPQQVRLRCGLLPYRALHRRELLSTNLQTLLRYEDRLSMHFAVEARLPFCDYRIANMAHRCKPNDFLRDGWSKYILRDAMRGLVPDEILWRREKRGFQAPIEALIDHSGGVREEAIESLDLMRELLDVERCRKAIADGDAPWQLRWRLINLAVSLNSARGFAQV